jgi:hypothetical protein
LVASLGLFLLAHVLFFSLYYPNRYVQRSVPLVFALAAGLAIGILLEAVARRVRPSRRRLAVCVLTTLLGMAVAAYPVPPYRRWRPDFHPAVTAYLQEQPKSILVAGVPSETDSVPMFSRRRVVASRLHAVPYHVGYYGELSERIHDLIEAYYAESLSEVLDFAARYGVDVFLVNRAAFDKRTFAATWYPGTAWEPYTSAIADRLDRRESFVLLEYARRCAVVDDGAVAAVPTTCLWSSGGGLNR